MPIYFSNRYFPEMSKSEFLVLKRKAWEYRRIAQYAITDELFDQALLNYNFALEMLMKAVLLKEGISYRKTHDLEILSKSKNSKGVKIFLSSFNTSRYIFPLWIRIYNAWSPDMRYQNLEFETEEFIELLEAYEEVYIWIENQFLLS